jgi:hypothetical protein
MKESTKKIKGRIQVISDVIMKIISCLLLLLACFLSLASDSTAAGISDRVIAFVDDQAITLSELKEQYGITVVVSPDITMPEVLNTMINRLVLLREARKYRIEAASADEVIKEYVDLKIRAFIRVSDEEVEKYYSVNIADLQGKGFEEVRDEIEKYLTERELNERLREMLSALREKAYIRMYLETN